MKILVVDDELDIKDLFLQRFRREIRKGVVNFEFAYSGEEAVEFLEAHQHEAILILSDINMPGMSGLDLLKKIKHNYNEPPPAPIVMMITAYGDNENYTIAKSLGADDFLTKPLNFSVLKEKLNLQA